SISTSRATVEEKLEYLYRRRVLIDRLINYLEQCEDEDRSVKTHGMFSRLSCITMQKLAS
ncbi:MAG: hypothetical protein ABFD86_07070, partial [Bryobacteraceae bacterium]